MRRLITAFLLAALLVVGKLSRMIQMLIVKTIGPDSGRMTGNPISYSEREVPIGEVAPIGCTRGPTMFRFFSHDTTAQERACPE